VSERFRLTVNGTESILEADPDTPAALARCGMTLPERHPLGLRQRSVRRVLRIGRRSRRARLRYSVVVGCGQEHHHRGRLGSVGALHPLPGSLSLRAGSPCGYCTSGILISAAALLARNPTPTEDEVRAALDRNLCRCGSHNRMVRAVLRVAAGVRT